MTNSSLVSSFFARKPFHSWADAAFDGRKTGIFESPALQSREVIGDHVLVKRVGKPWEVSRAVPLLPSANHEPLELVMRSVARELEPELDLTPYELADDAEHIAFTAVGDLVQIEAW